MVTGATLKGIFQEGNGGWVGAVVRLGVTTVLALGLTYFLVVRVEGTQALIVANQLSIMNVQSAIIASINEARVTMTLFATSQERDTRVMTALLLQTCLNTSKGEAQRSACVMATTEK